MFLTGFADEAGASIDTQIEATRRLGWKFIESRAIGAGSLDSLTDAEFDELCAKLDAAGIRINCFGSRIANWAKHPRRAEDFEASRTELLNAIPRMRRLGIKMLRGMSFLTPTDEAPDSPELEEIIFRKVGELVRICEDAGIVYGHENCMNYGGLSFRHTLKLLDRVQSPNFRLIFDTGNPTFNYRRIGPGPWPLQSSWEFYRNVREFIAYVHIKDGTALPREDGARPDAVYTFAGDGCGDVRAIVTDLRVTGYDGGFSMEPHLGTVFHDAKKPGGDLPEAEREQRKFDLYVEYGRRFEKLLAECGWTV